MDSDAVQYVTTSDGFSIAYAVKGEGTPLVFLPRPYSHLAILSNVATNRAAFEALAASFRLIRYDSRGQGLSTRGLPDDHSMAHYGLDLEALVDYLRLDRFVLLGPLTFGRVALRYAVEHPERVSALVFWNPMSGNPDLDVNARPAMQIDLPLQNWELFLETQARLIYPLEEPAQAKEWLREATTRADRVAYARAWHSLHSAISPSIQTPTLIIASRSGSWAFSSEETSKIMAATSANARLALFDDPGGGLFLPGPAIPPAVELIRDFVEKLPDSPQAISGSPLTARENEVAVLIARGRTNRQIAGELVISKQTADRHVSNILGKLDFTSRAQLAAWVVERGNAFSSRD